MPSSRQEERPDQYLKLLEAVSIDIAKARAQRKKTNILPKNTAQELVDTVGMIRKIDPGGEISDQAYRKLWKLVRSLIQFGYIKIVPPEFWIRFVGQEDSYIFSHNLGLIVDGILKHSSTPEQAATWAKQLPIELSFLGRKEFDVLVDVHIADMKYEEDAPPTAAQTAARTKRGIAMRKALQQQLAAYVRQEAAKKAASRTK